jgi:ASC-1-like (ASCH) protein
MKLGFSAMALTTLQLGRKTIEPRLNRGQFAKIQPGWVIRFECGPMFQEVEVVDVRPYASFKILLEKEPFKRVSPWCHTAEQALEEFFAKHGSLDMEHSVVAFEVRCKDTMVVSELVLPSSKKQILSTAVAKQS